VAGGLELRLVVGVDFSAFYASTEPGGESKLRYATAESADAGAPNPYETVLRTLGAVLAPCACSACLPLGRPARQLTRSRIMQTTPTARSPASASAACCLAGALPAAAAHAARAR
jgi:hypothetical protein